MLSISSRRVFSPLTLEASISSLMTCCLSPIQGFGRDLLSLKDISIIWSFSSTVCTFDKRRLTRHQMCLLNFWKGLWNEKCKILKLGDWSMMHETHFQLHISLWIIMLPLHCLTPAILWQICPLTNEKAASRSCDLCQPIRSLQFFI